MTADWWGFVYWDARELAKISVTVCSEPLNLALVKMSPQKKHLVAVDCNRANVDQIKKQCMPEYSCAPENRSA